MRTATRAYAEHGSTGLSREARRIWQDEPEPSALNWPAMQDIGTVAAEEPAWPPRLSDDRCKACQYRRDALGHARACGVSA